jgi:hypothetical protein
MKKVTEYEPQLDLLDTRRQLIAMRSLHSYNRRVAIEINNLIGKTAHLHRPDDPAHEKHLIEMIAKTRRAVDLVISRSNRPGVNPLSFARERWTKPHFAKAP